MVSMLGLVSVAYVILSFHYARSLAHGLGRSRNEPRDADLPEYAAWREENHAFNEKARARIEREREQAWCAAKWWQRGGGGQTPPPRSRFFNEGEGEGEVPPPPLFSLRITPPLLHDIIVGSHKMHIFTTNIPTFHARYRRYMPITNEFHEFC
jgi:hypothetical protein